MGQLPHFILKVRPEPKDFPYLVGPLSKAQRMTSSRSEFLEQKEIVELLRIELEKAGSQRAWGQATGIDPSIVSKVLKGKLPPTPQIVHALKLRTVVVSEKVISRTGGHPFLVNRRGQHTKQPRGLAGRQ